MSTPCSGSHGAGCPLGEGCPPPGTARSTPSQGERPVPSTSAVQPTGSRGPGTEPRGPSTASPADRPAPAPVPEEDTDRVPLSYRGMRPRSPTKKPGALPGGPPGGCPEALDPEERRWCNEGATRGGDAGSRPRRWPDGQGQRENGGRSSGQGEGRAEASEAGAGGRLAGAGDRGDITGLPAPGDTGSGLHLHM